MKSDPVFLGFMALFGILIPPLTWLAWSTLTAPRPALVYPPCQQLEYRYHPQPRWVCVRS